MMRKKRQRVVLIDDNAEFRRSLAAYVGSLDSVEVAGQGKDGREAFYLTHSLKPDLVLMDISMPGMGGMEAARRIKEAFPRTLIYFISVHEEQTYKTLADVIGVDGFISKNTLKQDLDVLLNRSNFPTPS